MPNLAIALNENSDDDLYEYYAIKIQNYGDAMVVDFPLLYNSSGLSLAGNFKRYSQSNIFSIQMQN
jgi:hypothetical protein